MRSLLWGGALVLFLALLALHPPPTTSSSIFGFQTAKKEQKEETTEERDARVKRQLFEKGLLMKEKPVMLQKNETLHLVIVRWNENLTWVRDFFPDVDTTVIQKANDHIIDPTLKTKLSHLSVGQQIDHHHLTLDPSLHQPDLHTPYLNALPRVKFDFVSNTNRLGRECSGYIWWILENYDNLPNWVMFVHGAPEKSASLARSYLTEPRGEFQSFSGNIVNRCFEKYNGEEGRAGGEFFLQDWEDLLRDINIDPPHCIRNFCCANFVAHRSRLQVLPKEAWRKLLLYVLLPAKGPGWRNNCYHLEHFWHMLLGERSHTYIGFAPHPESSASKILSDSGEAKRRWDEDYRPFLKPERTRFG